MSRNVVLENSKGEQILPVTTSENVFLNMNMTLKEYLEGLNAGESAYILPVATTTTLGGFKVGDGLEITEDGTLNCIANGRAVAGARNLTTIKYGTVGVSGIATYKEV